MVSGKVEIEVGADDVAVLTIVNPPLNCLSFDVIFGLREKYEQALAREDVKAIVLAGENDREPRTGYLSIDIITDIFEGARKPCVAAIGGLTIGGGLEIALASHGRVSTPDAQIGLPELQIGIIPALGGIQRLPRLVGIAKALEMLLASSHPDTSKLVNGEEALASGLVDAVAAPSELVETARLLALDIAESRRPWVKVLERTDRIEPLEEAKIALKLARIQEEERSADLKHPLICIDVIEEGIVSGPRAGLLKEATCSKELVFSDSAKKLIAAILQQTRNPQ